MLVANSDSELLIFDINEEDNEKKLVAKIKEMDDSYMFKQIILSLDESRALIYDD